MSNDKVLNKSLSIRIATNGLSFCTYAPDEEKPFEYKRYNVEPTVSLAANLKRALMTEPILQKQYQRVNVLIASPHAICMPAEYFDAENSNSIFKFNFPKASSMHISYNVLNHSGIAVVFGIERNIYQLLLDDFPQARFYASPSTLIEYVGNRNKIERSDQLFAYLHEKELTLYAFSNGAMMGFNTFSVVATEDSMYYILNMLQQLKFSQVEDVLTIAGDTGKEKELKSKISVFIKNTTVVDCKVEFSGYITEGNADIPFDLQTLLICGF